MVYLSGPNGVPQDPKVVYMQGYTQGGVYAGLYPGWCMYRGIPRVVYVPGYP